ncbi:hypothetical protein ACAH01_15015 [Halomicrobium sp. HM KBTZ05]|uniref:Polyprenyl synthetase n=1 Tax=Halomicrobium mukohataei TaxID=57705 RepID=A0A847UDC6_9EURY|nr:hypothetical protein [Halomicrobium mukohataei]NLV09490.1 hypothetical protein [Halomicrobium mukohataei]
MEEAAAVRRAALAAVDDVDPARLRDRIEDRLDAASMTPGVCTLVSASAAGCEGQLDGLSDRAAGVQLIYEGLRLTRALAHDDPWAGGDRDAADLDVLIADILVSRGFYLLARTEAADAAVDVVRAFGTDQTVRRETDDPTLDRNLEADVLELAAVAGVTAAGNRPAPRLREYASDLVTDGLPPVETFADEDVRETLAALTTDATSADGVRTSADH